MFDDLAFVCPVCCGCSCRIESSGYFCKTCRPDYAVCLQCGWSTRPARYNFPAGTSFNADLAERERRRQSELQEARKRWRAISSAPATSINDADGGARKPAACVLLAVVDASENSGRR